MKRLALVAAVIALAACAKKDETPAADTSAMAPVPADTGMKMDTTAMSSTTTTTTTIKK